VTAKVVGMVMDWSLCHGLRLVARAAKIVNFERPVHSRMEDPDLTLWTGGGYKS